LHGRQKGACSHRFGSIAPSTYGPHGFRWRVHPLVFAVSTPWRAATDDLANANSAQRGKSHFPDSAKQGILRLTRHNDDAGILPRFYLSSGHSLKPHSASCLRTASVKPHRFSSGVSSSSGGIDRDRYSPSKRFSERRAADNLRADSPVGAHRAKDFRRQR